MQSPCLSMSCWILVFILDTKFQAKFFGSDNQDKWIAVSSTFMDRLGQFSATFNFNILQTFSIGLRYQVNWLAIPNVECFHFPCIFFLTILRHVCYDYLAAKSNDLENNCFTEGFNPCSYISMILFELRIPPKVTIIPKPMCTKSFPCVDFWWMLHFSKHQSIRSTHPKPTTIWK